MALTDLDHPGHLHAHQPGVSCCLTVQREAASSPVHNHNIDILRSDKSRGHVLVTNNCQAQDQALNYTAQISNLRDDPEIVFVLG